LTTPLLKVEDVDVFLGYHHILYDVSMELNRGEIVALLGRNGAGKTTLIKSILGIVHPKSGRIFIDGVDTTYMPPHQIIELGVSTLPQGGRIFPELTVMENLKIGFVNNKIDENRVREVLELFPRIKDRLNQRSGTLSGGERQMLCWARVLLGKPKLLLMDEPLSAFMPKIVEQVKNIMKELKNQGVSILIIEQKVRLALEMSDRVYIMVTGQIGLHSDAKNLLENKEELVKYLGVRSDVA